MLEWVTEENRGTSRSGDFKNKESKHLRFDLTKNAQDLRGEIGGDLLNVPKEDLNKGKSTDVQRKGEVTLQWHQSSSNFICKVNAIPIKIPTGCLRHAGTPKCTQFGKSWSRRTKDSPRTRLHGINIVGTTQVHTNGSWGVMDTHDNGGIPNQGGKDNVCGGGGRKVRKNQSGSPSRPYTKVFSRKIKNLDAKENYKM